MTLEEKARALFFRQHPDAVPALAELAWETDPELRRFWIAEVSFVFGVPDD